MVFCKAQVFSAMNMFVAVMFFVVMFSSSTSHAKISIVDVSHPANYKLTKNPNNLDQLTDGKIVKHPIWTRNGSLGWVNRTPLSLNLNIDSIADNISCKGIIRIHTGKSIKSGVNVPKRLDVYAYENDNRYRYLSGKQINVDSYSDGGSHWIEVSNINLYRDMVLVVHASNRFIMLDEIEASTGNCVDALPEAANNEYLKNPVTDSVLRLKGYYKSTSVRSDNDIGDGLTYHVYNNVDEYMSGIISEYQSPSNISGFNGETESRIIVIFNGTDVRVDLNLVDLNVDIKQYINLYKIEKVLAANGQTIYDPLLPVSDNRLTLDSNSQILLLIKFELSEKIRDKRKISLVLNSAEKNDSIKIDFSINVLNLIDNGVLPKVNVWAYRQDRLFKIDEAKSMKLLSDCGVNVFVLHSALLPGNKHKKEWTLNIRDRFIDDLSFYKDKGLILLFVDWSARVVSFDKSGTVDKKLIRRWMNQLMTAVSEAGVTYDQWALYPIDEPSGTDLEYLDELVTVIKSIDDNVQIYANPISSTSDPTYFRQIRNISNQVEYWQPDIKYIKNQGLSHFSSLSKDWWVYSNPKSPAKSSGDMFYRAIAWNAWSTGATGFGFWSFSDTGKSSAWDDFDGTRPDYAVVYEHKDTIISSLRWESFCDGVDDFRLLSSVKDKSKLTSVISKNLYNTTYSRDDIYKHRQYIFELQSKYTSSNFLDIK